MKATLLALTPNEIDGVRAILPRIKREWASRILRWGTACYFQFFRELWFWKPR